MQLVLSTPVLYALELTPLCNNRCAGCFNVFIDDTSHRTRRAVRPLLNAAQWRTLLAKIQPHAERVKITGGEPTLHPEFDAIVKTLADFNISFSIFTNARWRRPDHLIARLKAVPQFLGFLVSLHGADAEAHEAYSRVPGSFEQTIGNIQRATQAGLNVATSTVIHRRNLDQFADIVALALRLGADHAVMNRYLGPPVEGIEPTAEELRKAVAHVERLRQGQARVKLGNCVPQCFAENSSTGCLAGVAYCAISPWGEMRPCSHSPTAVEGDLLAHSIQELWRSPQMQAWRKLMPAECEEDCPVFSTCHGACRAQIELQPGHRDPLRRTPVEPMLRQPTDPITLYEGLRPKAICRLRQEEFGSVALRGNHVVPIRTKDERVLNACNGMRTLGQIQKDFGTDGLRLVVQWYQKGLVEFAPLD